MKKNKKILNEMREFSSDWLGKVNLIIGMLIIILTNFIGLILAYKFKNYILASIVAYVLVFIFMCYTKKVFFKTLNQKLLERTDMSILLFVFLPIIMILLSWKYFIAFLLTIVIAFMTVDFLKVIEVKE